MKSYTVALCTVVLGLLSGCSGGGGGGGNGNSPATLQNRVLNVVVSGGAAPFTSSGSYVFTPTSGNGTSGSYRIDGNVVQSNIGTYTWTKTGPNTASLIETEQSGTLVQNTLIFSTPVTGTIHSSSSNRGGFQDGSFTLN